MTSPADEKFQRAISAMQTGKFDDAERFFKQAIKLQPGHVPALNVFSDFLARSGRLEEAERYARLTLAAYDDVLRQKPKLAEAWFGRGHILSRLGRNLEAIDSYDRGLALAPNSADGWFNRGLALIGAGRLDDAVASLDRTIAAKLDFSQAHLLRAKLLADSRRHDEALAGVDRLLAIAPGLAEAWLGRSNILFDLKRHDEALAACERALALKPGLAEAWLGRGNVFNGQKRYQEALAAYDKALALNPRLGGAWHGRGNVLNELKRYDEALVAYDKALAASPDLAESWLGRGNALTELNRHDEAFAAFDRALALIPDLAEAWLGRGNVLVELKQYNDALAAYDRALALDGGLAEGWLGRGNVYFELRHRDEAFAAYDKALALSPDLAEAWLGRGNVSYEFRKYDDALAGYDRALVLKPDLKYVRGDRLNVKLHLGDWTNLQSGIAELVAAVAQQKPVIAPFPFLSMSSSAADQLQCTKSFVADQPSFPAIWRGEKYSHDRIRVAYLSADFRNQAVGQLAVGLYERHDRSRFETTAISFGPDDQSELRGRIKSAFDDFIDVQEMSDEDVARLIRSREIDIAVDLMGFTRYCRFNILGRRAAPVQINYLGYPGTMAADCIDYILADPTIVPKEHFAFYGEQVVWLPDAYQANDDKRRISDHTPPRGECGLPERAFVFCCFNNTFKIAPETFEVWMRIMNAKQDSVLWLLEANPTVVKNLRREAGQRGVAAERLIFAPRVPLADHLARHRHVDLFLDTLPYNAHTTTSDALWAGVPVLTCLGATFAGRVAASLVKAIGLDELVTNSLQEYEALALKLAGDPAYLASIKDRLARNRTTFPLFKTERFVRYVEAAYTTMWERCQRGEKPQAFAVERID